MLHEFFNKEFQQWVSFRIPHYLQKYVPVSFCGKVLPGSKTEDGNSPQPGSTKYSEDSTGLPFWVSSYNPHCWSLDLRIMSWKLGQNDFMIYTQ